MGAPRRRPWPSDASEARPNTRAGGSRCCDSERCDGRCRVSSTSRLIPQSLIPQSIDVVDRRMIGEVPDGHVAPSPGLVQDVLLAGRPTILANEFRRGTRMDLSQTIDV